MSLLRFYTDAHIDTQVAVQLRNRGVDVVRCQEVGLTEADDETHLQYAAVNGLALITKDEGFRARHFRWIGEEKQHYGIFFCSDRRISAVGQIVNVCYAFAELIEAGAGTVSDLKNLFVDVSQE